MPSSGQADRRAAAVATLLGASLFLGSWALLHTEPWQRFEIVDTPTYEEYGDAVVRGEVPYRDFTPEYPPLALPVFVVPSLVVGADASQERYARAFDLEMLALGLALVGVVAWALVSLGASPTRLVAALALVGLAPLLLGSVVLSRFDLWPALLCAAAVAALVAGRERLAGAALAAGVAAKLYPAVLVPIAAVWLWRRRRQRVASAGAAFAVVLVAAVVPFVLVARDGVADALGRQLDRPLQLESLPAAVLVVLGRAGVESGHGSQNLAGDTGFVLGVASVVALALALACIWTLFARGEASRERLVAAAAAAVVAAVALGKVLSPQFLLWLVPLVPLVRGARGLLAGALLASALLLTQGWFPRRYWDYAADLDEGVATLVLARDLVLVTLLAVLVSPLLASGRGAGMDERDPEEAVEDFQQDDDEPSGDEREFLEAEHVPETPGEPSTAPGEHVGG